MSGVNKMGLFQVTPWCIRFKCDRGINTVNRLILVLLTLSLLSCVAYGKYGGGSGTLGDPYLIYTAEQMNTIGLNPDDWNARFALMANIDLGVYTGDQFNIIGRWTNTKGFTGSFGGSFDGRGHAIRNFTYCVSDGNSLDPLHMDSVGIFGCIYSHSWPPFDEPVIKDIVLIDPNVDVGSGHYVGALVGRMISGTISRCSVQNGSVSGNTNVGGLIGGTYCTSLSSGLKLLDCSVSCRVTGMKHVGGIAGVYDGCFDSVIFKCSSMSEVFGETIAGGLVGFCRDTIDSCFASGKVIGHSETGGLVGNIHGIVRNSYSIALVSGITYVGGLVGVNHGTVDHCYSSGLVTGTENVGGLIGSLVEESFYPAVVVSESFWDIETSGQTDSASGTGKTTLQMRQRSTYGGWDFADTWDIAEDQTYPFLRRCAAGDINGDGTVNFLDFVLMAFHWLENNNP